MTDKLPGLIAAREIALGAIRNGCHDLIVERIDRAIADARQSETGGDVEDVSIPLTGEIDRRFTKRLGNPSPGVSEPARVGSEEDVESVARAHPMNSGPCIVCGKRNYPMSMGGPQICPSCDCGNPPEVSNPRIHDWPFQPLTLAPVMGCICPGDATPFCQNEMCPRKSSREQGGRT